MTKIHTYISTKADGDIKTLKTDKKFCGQLEQKLGVSYEQIIFPEQPHSDDIYEPGVYEPKLFDGAVTDRKNTVLCAISADCLGVVFYDKTNEVIATAHCGRRGTELRLAQKVVQKMLEYGAELSQIQCQFGPSIAQEHYEVTMDCGVDFFPEAKKEISTEKQLLDIPLENKLQLLEVGILEKNIILSEINTYTDENYYSHRRGDAERFSNFIWMSE